MQKMRKRNEEEVMVKKKEEIWKRPVKPKDEPVPFVSFDHLRPLDDAEQFMTEFPEEIERRFLLICRMWPRLRQNTLACERTEEGPQIRSRTLVSEQRVLF